jgi:hypothetical protein
VTALEKPSGKTSAGEETNCEYEGYTSIDRKGQRMQSAANSKRKEKKIQ